MNEYSLAELLDRRQPIRVLGYRRATHGELDVLEVAVGAGGRRLEASKAVEARDFAQSMDRDDILDRRHVHSGTWIRPCVARQRLCVELCGRTVLPDFGPAACEYLKF